MNCVEWRQTFTERDQVLAASLWLKLIEWKCWNLAGLSGWTHAWRDCDGTLTFEKRIDAAIRREEKG